MPLSGYLMGGGFGTVQPVRDTFLDRDVLFKYMQDSQNNAQLINEVQGLSKARSRHVVEIYDVIKDSSGMVVGIIIEYLTGRDYSRFHAEPRNDPLPYVRILYQIATALVALHQAGIVHRDLKLENLKESASGILKIFDFGLASADRNYLTANNRGTFVYAAPELHEPNTPITKEMDVYALGVCAWALVSPVFPPELFENPPQKFCRAPSIQAMLGGLFAPEIAQLIDASLNPIPVYRPTALQLSTSLAKYLVQDKHRGIFVQGASSIFELSAANPNVHLKIGSLGKIHIHYDSLYFRVIETEGAVLINNYPATSGTILPDSCVLTFGDISLGPKRQWITFSSSHPGVVL